MKNNTQIKEILEITDGRAFGKALRFSQAVRIDITNPDELKASLITCLIELCDALDNDRVRFEKTEDERMFHALLALALTQVFDGQIPLEVVRQH